MSQKSSEISNFIVPPPANVGSLIKPTAPPLSPNVNHSPTAPVASTNSTYDSFIAMDAKRKESVSVSSSVSTQEESEKETGNGSWIQRLLPLTMRETPSWMVSLTVHVAIILLLALIPLSERIRTSISVLAGMSEAQDLGEEMTVSEIQADSAELETSQELAAILEPTLTELNIPEFKPVLTGSDLLIPNSLSSGLRGRTGPMKDALLRAYGGTKGTEDAVQAGLKWLARNQRSDGSWSLVGPYGEGAVSENKPAATAMAMLAFMGAGNTHQEGEYQANVLKGINAIKKFQDTDGFFADQSVGNQRTYAQAQCTIAVCELFGMTGDPELRTVAQKSVRYAEKSQAKNGGWRYQPRESGDTSVTGWYVMALISARMAGLDVDSEVLEKVHSFLDTVQRRGRTTQPNSDGERYAYQSYSIATPSMTAEGMLCRLYLGWNTKDPRIDSGAEFLCSQPLSADSGRISYYYWYYATTTLHHIGGDYWRQWNESMKQVLPSLQVNKGKEAGSWPPGEDPHEGGGGRLYTTCFAIYCLESYYRHLPLSEMAPK